MIGLPQGEMVREWRGEESCARAFTCSNPTRLVHSKESDWRSKQDMVPYHDMCNLIPRPSPDLPLLAIRFTPFSTCDVTHVRKCTRPSSHLTVYGHSVSPVFFHYVSYRGIRVAVSKFRQPRSKVIKLNTVKVDLCDWMWAVKRSVQGLQRASTVEVQGGGTVVHKEHWE